jgi:glucan-binding YG repeat protein
LAAIDSIIETQKTLEKQSKNQELEFLREQVQTLTHENRRMKERKTSIMQPSQKRITRTASNMKLVDAVTKPVTQVAQPVIEVKPVEQVTVVQPTPEPTVVATPVTQEPPRKLSGNVIPPPQQEQPSQNQIQQASEANKNTEILQAQNKNGFLTKEGDKFKTWHRRWFRILKEDVNYSLAYYQNLGEIKAIKAIPLAGAIVEFAREKENGSSRCFCFKIKTTGRTFYLNASSEDDRTEWMKALNIVVNLK